MTDTQDKPGFAPMMQIGQTVTAVLRVLNTTEGKFDVDFFDGKTDEFEVKTAWGSMLLAPADAVRSEWVCAILLPCQEHDGEQHAVPLSTRPMPLAMAVITAFTAILSAHMFKTFDVGAGSATVQ